MVYVIIAVCVYSTCMRVVVRAVGTPHMCVSHQPEVINLGRAAQFKARVYLDPPFVTHRMRWGGSLFSLGRAAISADLSNLRRDCGRAVEGNISAPLRPLNSSKCWWIVCLMVRTTDGKCMQHGNMVDQCHMLMVVKYASIVPECGGTCLGFKV